MEDKISLIERPAQPVLSIRTRTSVKDMSKVLGNAYAKIMQYMNEAGIKPGKIDGSPAAFTAYNNMDMDDLDIEIGFPVAAPAEGKGDIEKSEIPAGKYVTRMYKGPYSKMEPMYNETMKWMEEKSLEYNGCSYEFYFNSPEEVPEEELLTKILISVK